MKNVEEDVSIGLRVILKGVMTLELHRWRVMKTKNEAVSCETCESRKNKESAHEKA